MSTALNWWRLLPVSATQCPKDSAGLWWEVFGGMRVRHIVQRGHIYKARCPHCKREYDVLAPKETGASQ